MSWRKIIVGVFLLFTMTIYTSCSKAEKPIEAASVSKVSVRSGLTGEEFVVEDATQIGELTDRINALELRIGLRDNRNGYMYSVTLYNKEEKVIEDFTISDESYIIKDGYSYYIDCHELIEYINTITCSG